MKRSTQYFLVAAAFAVAAGRASAQAPATPGEAIGGALDAVSLRGTPPHPADFVIESRPERLDYAPLPVPGTGPQPAPKAAAEVERLKAELDAAGEENRRRAALVKVPEGQPPASAPQPAPRPNPRARIAGEGKDAQKRN